MLSKGVYPIRGVFPIINTPWTYKDEIDYESLGRLIEQGISDGINGCIVPAVASEVYKLSEQERNRLVEEVVKFVHGRIQVIVGVSDPDVKRSCNLAEHAITNDVDGILCAVPTEILGNKGSIKDYFLRLNDVGVPMLMIQDLDWNGYGIGLDVITEMWEDIETFRCLKLETVPTGYKMTQIIQATDGLMPIGVGWSLPQLIEALDRGTSFLTTTAVNKPFVHIFQMYETGRRDEAVKLFNRTLPYLAWAHQHIDISVHFYKLYCYRRGIFNTTRSRNPILPFDTYHRQIADEIVDELISIEENL